MHHGSSSSGLPRYFRQVLQAMPAAGLVTLIVWATHGAFASADSFLAAVVQTSAKSLIQPAGVEGGLPLAIIKIDEAFFESDFGARSPLDRCVLREALAGVLAANPGLKTLAIDLDLSPMSALPAQHPSEAVRSAHCQVQLDDLLQRTAARLSSAGQHGGGVILLAPQRDLPPAALRAALPWMQGMAASGIRFGHGRLRQSHGLVRSYTQCDRFWANQVGRGTAAAKAPEAVAAATPGAASTDLLAKPLPAFGALLGAGLWGKPVAAPTEASCDTAARPIAFHGLLQLQQAAADVSLARFVGDHPMAPEVPGLQHVVVGSGYSEDDRHLTPLGRLDGVDVHAAVAVDPSVGEHPWLPTVLEFAFGILLFGPLFHRLWSSYLGRWVDRALAGPAKRGAWAEVRETLINLLAALPIIAAVLFGALLMTAFSVGLSLAFGYWLNVVGIVLGMLIEAAAVSGVSVAKHMLLDERRRSQRLIAAARPDPVLPSQLEAS